MKTLVTLTLALFACCVMAQDKHLEPKLENIAWISGTWHGEAFGGKTEEIWSQPSGGSMMATFKLTVNDQVQFYEIEIIREIENDLVLQLKHFNKDLKGWETKDERFAAMGRAPHAIPPGPHRRDENGNRLPKVPRLN